MASEQTTVDISSNALSLARIADRSLRVAGEYNITIRVDINPNSMWEIEIARAERIEVQHGRRTP